MHASFLFSCRSVIQASARFCGVFGLIVLADIAFTPRHVEAAGDNPYHWTNTAGGIGSDVAYSVATDPTGNVYVAGYFQGTVDFDPGEGTDSRTTNASYSGFLTKYAADGSYQWTRTADGTSRSLAYSVATDPFGNVYVAGYFSGTADFDPGPGIDSRTSDGNDDLFITKFAADGSYQWTNTADGRAYSVATDPAGSIYVGGIIDSKNVLIKYAPDGTYQWTNTAGGVGYISPTYTYSVAVATDSAGNIYIAGYFSGTADFDPGLGTDSHTSNGGGDIFLTKYDATGAYLWTKTVGSTNQDSARAITIDSADNIYLAGEFEFTTDFDPGPGVDSRTNSSGVDIFVSKYSAEGIYEWTKAVAGGANIQVSSVTTDPAGDIYMAGSFAGGTDFDPGPAIDRRYNYGSANATPDIYLTKYAADGSYQGTKTIGGSSLERATALATDSAGDIYMAGYFLSNGLDFDPGTSTDNHYITSIGEFDFFLSKYGTTVYSTPTSEPTSTPGPTPTPTEQPTPTPTPEATPTPTPEPTPTPTPSPSATPTVTFPSDPDFSDGIEPNTGDSNTDFTFKAVYSHPDGTPGTIDLVLEVKDQNGEWQPYGQPMPMSVEENPDYENGAEFSYTLTDEIPAGEYRFAFSYNGGQPQVMGEFAVQASPSLTLSGLRQFDQHLDQDRRKLAFADDPTTPDIREIRETRRYQLVFQAQLQDAMAGENPEANLFLEAEIKKHDEPFTGNPNLPDSAAVVTGNTAEILFANYPNPAFPLEDGNYKWQARVKKQNSEGNWEYSQWQEYEEPDAPDNTDLIIRHTYRVAVILAETADRPHSSTAITGDAPCLLGELANKDYPNGRDAGYYEDLGTCVSDYFDETMYGTMPVEVDVVGGGWLNVDYGVHPNDSGNTLESTNEFLNAHLYPDVEFINKAISQHNLAPQLSNYDAVTVVTAGEPLTRSLDNRLYFNGRTWGWHDYPNWLFRDEAAGENALIAVSLSEDRGLGTWAHELTHALPKFYMAGHNGAPDLYSMGINEGEDSSAWALMGTGLNNGLLTNKTKGKVPPHIISYVKNLLGIHPEEIHPKSDYRDYVIPSLPYIGLLNPIIRYNLEDSTRSDAPSYYLFETRLKDSATWEKELPKDDINLLLYRVDKKYGQGSPRECINVVDILQAGDSRRDYDNNVVLSSQNASGSGADTEVTMNVRPFGFLDHALPIKGMVLNADCDLIAAADAENAPDIIYIETPLSKRIELVNHLFLGALQNSTDKTRSISSDKSYMLTVKSILVISIAVPLLYFLWFVAWYFYKHRQNKPKYFQWKIGVRICVGLVLAIVAFYFVQAVYVSGLQFDDGRRQEKGPSICPPGAECAPDPAYFPPDIDLHAVTPDGRHVGVNYETGEFENEISGSEVSGDLTFSSEWIFVPEIEEVKYYVSSHDRERFFGEHPELQESLPAEEINAEYSIYAKTIDPSSGISESEKQNMVIEPGESVIYTMSAVNPESPSLSEPLIIPAGTAIDITPPATTATLTGTEVTGQGYLPGATLTLTTTDNEGGVGVATTEYSLNDGTAWTPYTDPLVFGDEGEVTVLYRSRDALGNTEETQSLTFTIYVNHAPELAAIGNQTVDEGEELSFTATTTGTAGENGWYTSDITLALAAEDNVGGSGVQQISYSLDSGTTWNIYSTPLNFTQEGETELRFYATDNRGNAEAPQSLTIKIDKAAPATPARPTASAGTDSITLTWPATTDTTSGVAFYTILRNGNPVGTTADLSYTDTGLTPGTSYTYKLTATDLAGNTSAASLARTVLTKTVPMSISFTSSVSSINGVTTATLTWLVTGFTSCTASGGWSGLKALSGTMTVSPVTTTTYILTCTSGSSTAQSSVTVGVGSSSSSSSSSSGGSGGFGGWNW